MTKSQLEDELATLEKEQSDLIGKGPITTYYELFTLVNKIAELRKKLEELEQRGQLELERQRTVDNEVVNRIIRQRKRNSGYYSRERTLELTR